MTIGGGIRTLRVAMGLDQQAFSEAFRVSPTTVSRWENDKVTPEPTTLAALFQKASELNLSDAAEAIAKESTALFGILGAKMIFHSWSRFGQIAGRILEFRMESQRKGFGADIPEDMWQTLGVALELANSGKEDSKQLLAMVQTGARDTPRGAW